MQADLRDAGEEPAAPARPGPAAPRGAGQSEAASDTVPFSVLVGGELMGPLCVLPKRDEPLSAFVTDQPGVVTIEDPVAAVTARISLGGFAGHWKPLTAFETSTVISAQLLFRLGLVWASVGCTAHWSRYL